MVTEPEDLTDELTEKAKGLFVAGRVSVDVLEEMLDTINNGGGITTLPVPPYWRPCPLEDLLPIFGEPLMKTMWR